MGLAGLFSTSSEGLSATASVKAPWFFQLRFKDIASNHEHRQGKFQILILIVIVILICTPISKERPRECRCAPRAFTLNPLSTASFHFSSTKFRWAK